MSQSDRPVRPERQLPPQVGPADATRSAGGPPEDSSGRWILNSWQDLILFVGTPLLIVPLIWMAQQGMTIEAISLYVIAFGATGHHLPGLMRAYGDRELFRRFRVRFILAPLFLLAVCMGFAHQNLTGLIVIVLLWGVWHGMMQVYGFLRIYDAKVKSFAPITQRLDLAMCFAWFGGGLFLSPVRMEELLRHFYSSGGPLLTRGQIELFQNFWIVLLVVVTAAFVVNHVHQVLRGASPNPVKVLLMVSGFGFWWYAMVFIQNGLLGVAMFEIFHAVQYLAIVWLFNRKRVASGRQVGAFTRFLFRPSWIMVLLYVGLCFAYGGLTLVADTSQYDLAQRLTLTLFGLVGASSLLHFYYDGFIWKGRERETWESLGRVASRSGTAQPALARAAAASLVPAWAVHGAKWSLFVIPVALLANAEWQLKDRQLTEGEVVARREHIADALPNSWLAQANLGEVLSQVGRIEEAIERYQRSLAIYEHPQVHVSLAKELQQIGYIDEAIDHLRSALRLQPTLHEARLELGRVMFALHEDEEARSYFEQVLAADDRNAHAHLGLAILAVRLEDRQSALDHYALAIDAEPHMSEAFLGRAMLFVAEGENELALRDFARALEIAPDRADAYNSRGTLHLRLGQLDAALADYDRALELEPLMARAYRNRATVWSTLGEFQKAVDDFTRSLEVEPFHPHAMSGRGAMHYRLGRLQDAINDWTRTIQLDSEHYGAVQGLAMVLSTAPDARYRNGRQAVELARHACDLVNYGEPAALETLAAAYAELGDFEQAIQYQQQAIERAVPQMQELYRAQLERYQAGQPVRKDPLEERALATAAAE